MCIRDRHEAKPTEELVVGHMTVTTATFRALVINQTHHKALDNCPVYFTLLYLRIRL